MEEEGGWDYHDLVERVREVRLPRIHVAAAIPTVGKANVENGRTP